MKSRCFVNHPGFLILWGDIFQFAITPEQRKAVLADLNHRSMLTANGAARAISLDRDPALLPGLVWTLRHGRRTHNRVEAAYALGFMTGTEGTAALESALSNKSENTKVRAFAAETLAHRHRRGSHAVLLRNLQDPSREVRFWCAFALGQMREKKASPALSRLPAILRRCDESHRQRPKPASESASSQ